MIILKGVENKKFIRFNKDYHFLRLQTFFKAIDWCSLSNRYHIPLSFFFLEAESVMYASILAS